MAEDNHESFIDTGVITAEQLAKKYEESPQDADEQFLDDEITIRGQILRIDNVVSAVVVRARGKGEEYSGTHLRFHLKNRKEASCLKKDKPAIFQGICRGLDTNTSPTGEEIGWVTIQEASLIE